MNGIFSGNGTVTPNSIQLGSSSFRLINDINICLSRLGIFGKITITPMKSNNLGTLNMANVNLLSIRSKWAKIFQEEIELISVDKHNILKKMHPSKEHINFKQVNDTVLDAIVEINKVDVSKYPKVYDLTIPSTLNFGLANGLHVVDTSDSGYISKKFIKASEELMVNYDFTVRNSSGYIVQFGYGDDNFDPIKLEKVPRIELFEYDDKTMKKIYQHEDDLKYFESFMTPEAIDQMMNDPNYKNILNDEYNEILDMRYELRYNYFKNTEAIGDINTYTPINLYRVIPSQLIKFNIENFMLSDITPQYVINTYNQAMKDIVKYLPEKENNWKLFKIIFKSFLSTKRVIKEYRMNKAVYDSIILLIKDKMLNALVQPGELVGIISSQTLGEISTQMTLNTHHSAGVGVGSLVITEGIPRLREIINISKQLKNKNMSIYLKYKYSSSKDDVRKIQSKFAYTQLKDLLSKTEILYSNESGITDQNEDYEFIKSYKEFSKLFDIDNIDESCLSPWILRLTFDKESLMIRKITVQEIQETIKENFHNDQEIDCIYSDDSVNDVVMRIRIKHDNKGSFYEFMKDFEKQLIELSLRGFPNIDQVEVMESNIIKYDIDGSIKPTKEYMLKTMGSNLIDILSNDAVDISRTLTNDIIEFYELFGIEAVRELIFKELHKIYNDKEPNPRHLQMLADTMTYRGKLMSIDRHGINKNSQIGPIGKASFEEVMNIFTKASVFAEKDNMKGISANIFAGQFCKSGTNVFDILVDEDKMIENISNPGYNDNNDEYDEYHVTNEVDVDKAFSNAYSSKFDSSIQNVKDEDFSFGFGIEQTKEFTLNKIGTDKNIIVSQISDKSEESNESNNKSKIGNEIDYNKVSIEEDDNEDFNQISVEEPESNNINFDAITINEPNKNDKDNEIVEEPEIVEESEIVEEPKVKTKKIRVSKKKIEEPIEEPIEKPKKKIKVSKKK
jgi:hypothetical protein